MQLWGCWGPRLPGGDAAVAEVSGRDDALQGEGTRLLSAWTRLSPHSPLLPFPSSKWGSCSALGVPNLSSGPMVPSPLCRLPLSTPARRGRMVQAVGGVSR